MSARDELRMSEVRTSEQLWDFMTTPTDGLVEFASELDGEVMVMGAAGKMGVELAGTLIRADREAGVSRTVHAASRFSDPTSNARRTLDRLGAVVHRGDFTEPEFLQELPDVPNIVFMAGMKFGTSRDWRLAFHLNCIMPYLVGERFADSRIVAYSSANPYPHTPVESGGCTEDDALSPQGVYGWGIVARESALATTARRHADQRTCLFRLCYAQHLGYGVLVDLARMVRDEEPVSLSMPAVNLISQRDAIDVSLRALGHCQNPPFVLNCCGPVVRVRRIVEKLADAMNRRPRFADDEAETALIADDSRAVELFGPFRDTPDEMTEAAARWVVRGGEYWDTPTLFGKVSHQY